MPVNCELYDRLANRTIDAANNRLYFDVLMKRLKLSEGQYSMDEFDKRYNDTADPLLKQKLEDIYARALKVFGGGYDEIELPSKADQHKVVNYLSGMLVTERLKVEDSRADNPTIDAPTKKSLKKYISDLIDGKVEAGGVNLDKWENIKKYFDDHDGIKGYFSKILANLYANYKVDSLDNTSEENLYDKTFEETVFESSRKDNVNSELKEIISVLVTDRTDDYIGELMFAEFDPTFNKLQIELADMIDAEEMEEKLRKMAFFDPMYGKLLERVKLPEDPSDIQYEKQDCRRNGFFTSLRNSYYNSILARLREDIDDGKIVAEVRYSNDNTPENNLIAQWKENLANSDLDHEARDIIKELKEELQTKIGKGEDYNSIIEDLSDLMRTVGIDVVKQGDSVLQESILKDVKYHAEPGKEIAWISKNYVTDFINIVNNIIEAKPVFASSDADFTLTQSGHVKNLATRLRIFSEYGYESVSRNVRGDSINNINQPSYLTDVINAFKADSPQKIAWLKNFFAERSQTPEYIFSNWITDFVNSDGSINVENCRKLQYRLIGGLDIQDSDGLRYKDYTIKDGLIFNVALYAFMGRNGNTGTYVLPVQADAGNNYALQYKRIPVEKAYTRDSGNAISINFTFRHNGKSEQVNMGWISKDSEIYKAFVNNLFSELARMREARTLLFDEGGELKRVYAPTRLLTEEEKASPSFMQQRRQSLSKLIQYAYFKDMEEDGTPIVIDDNGKVTGNVFKFQYFTHLNSNGSLFNANGTISSDPAVITRETSHMNKDAVWYKINKEILPLYFEEFYKKEINRFIASQTIPSHFQIVGKTTEQVIIDMALNYAIFVPEYDMLFAGGARFAKNADDGIKREKQVSTHGMPNNIGGTFTGAYVRDFRVKAGTYDQILNAFREDIKRRKSFLSTEEIEAEAIATARPYEAINSTDSATYITKDRLVKILNGLGRSGKTLEIRQAIKRILDDTYDSKDFNLVFNPLKPFYYWMHFDNELKTTFPVQIKNSEVPLLPNIIKGTDLEAVAWIMEKQGIDALIFESAGKVGARGISSIGNTDGTINLEKLDNSLNKQIFYNAGYRIQLENPESHIDYQATMGLQPKKLMLAGLSPEAIYGNLMGHDGTLNGRQLLDRHNQIESALIRSSRDKLMSRIGATYVNGELQFDDIRKLQSIMQDEVLRSRLNDNFFDSIALEELEGSLDFSMPLFQSIAGAKLKSVLLSLYTRNITNQKITGFGMVQTPGQLFRNSLGISGHKYGISLSSIPKHLQNRIELIDRKREQYKEGNLELQASEVKDGKVTRMEVLLPATSKAYFNRTKDGRAKSIIDINELPEELRTFFAYRIPNQGKYSSSVIEVVGFLPPEAGSQVVIPNEILTRMGSDFDIDKLYGMGFSFHREGKTLVVDQFTTDAAGARQRWIDRANEILSDDRELSKESLALFDTKEEAEEAEDFEASKMMDDRIIQQLVDEGRLPSLEDFVILPLEEQNSQNVMRNAMLSDFISVMQSPYHFAEQSTPTSFARLKVLARKYGKNERRPYNKQLIIDNETRRFEARQDKQLVGVSASNNAYALTVMSNLNAELPETLGIPVRYTKSQVEKYNIKERYEDSILKESSDGSVVVLLNKIGWANDNPATSIYGDMLSENYNMIIGAATDGIKDPSLGYLGFNMLTVNALGAPILVGHDWEWVAALGNQPIIKMYQEIFDNESSGYDGILRQQQRQRVSPKTTAKRRIKGMLAKRAGKEKFDTEELALSTEQLNHNISNFDWSFQAKVWQLFERLEAAGQTVTGNLLALRSDGIGAGPTVAQTRDFVRSIDKAEMEGGVIVDGESIMDRVYPNHFNIDRESEYSALQDYLEQSNLSSLDLMRKFFVEQTPAIEQITKMITALLPENAPGLDYARYENMIVNYATAYLSAEFPMFALGYKDLFKGDDTLVDRIIAMKKKIEERIAKGETNVPGALILPAIELENTAADLKRNFNLKLFGLRNTTQGYTPQTENLLIEDWYNMLTNFDNKEIRELGMDMIKANYHLYGMLPSLRSLTSLVPVKWLKEIGYAEFLRQQGAKLANNGALDSLFETYLQHNYRDINLIPNTNWRAYDPSTGLMRYGRQTWDEKTKTLKVSLKFEGSDPDLATSKYVTARITNPNYVVNGKTVKGSVVPVLFRYIGTDQDQNRWFRPIDKKGLGPRMYEFGDESIIYTSFPKTDEEYKILISQEFNISLQDEDNMQIDLTEPKVPPVTPKGGGGNSIQSGIDFREHRAANYADRTKENASADVTIAIAVDFNTLGEKATKKSVDQQGKLYLPIDTNTFGSRNEVEIQAGLATQRIAKLGKKEITLNIAGNGIYTLNKILPGFLQAQADNSALELLTEIKIRLDELGIKITSVRTGGQTGFDEAGAKAAQKLGIPTIVLAPKGWKFRNEQGQDISDEAQFKARFAPKSNIEPKYEEDLDKLFGKQQNLFDDESNSTPPDCS